MGRIVFAFLLSFYSYATFGQQFPSQIWHDGKIVLLEGDTLVGQIKYSQETDIVEYTHNNIKTGIALSAKKVLYFEIFDRMVNRYREFYALPYAINSDYETPLMFEVIFSGQPITVLSREKIEYRVVNNPYTIAGSYSRMELVYTYYFITKDGRIRRFSGNRKDLLWLLKDRSSDIKKYMKTNRIRPERRADMVRVVAYYNSLFEAKNKE